MLFDTPFQYLQTHAPKMVDDLDDEVVQGWCTLWEMAETLHWTNLAKQQPGFYQ